MSSGKFGWEHFLSHMSILLLNRTVVSSNPANFGFLNCTKRYYNWIDSASVTEPHYYNYLHSNDRCPMGNDIKLLHCQTCRGSSYEDLRHKSNGFWYGKKRLPLASDIFTQQTFETRSTKWKVGVVVGFITDLGRTRNRMFRVYPGSPVLPDYEQWRR